MNPCRVRLGSPPLPTEFGWTCVVVPLPVPAAIGFVVVCVAPVLLPAASDVTKVSDVAPEFGAATLAGAAVVTPLTGDGAALVTWVPAPCVWIESTALPPIDPSLAPSTSSTPVAMSMPATRVNCRVAAAFAGATAARLVASRPLGCSRPSTAEVSPPPQAESAKQDATSEPSMSTRRRKGAFITEYRCQEVKSIGLGQSPSGHLGSGRVRAGIERATGRHPGMSRARSRGADWALARGRPHTE